MSDWVCIDKENLIGFQHRFFFLISIQRRGKHCTFRLFWGKVGSISVFKYKNKTKQKNSLCNLVLLTPLPPPLIPNI